MSRIICCQAPNIAWNEVVKELDYTGFQIASRAGFELLIHGLFRGLSDPFPVDVLYSLWKNKEGQVTAGLLFGFCLDFIRLLVVLYGASDHR